MNMLLLTCLLGLAQAADAELLAAMDARWAAGGVGPADAAQEQALQEAIRTDPADFELLWRVARLRYRQSDREADSARASTLSKQGWDAAEAAKKANAARVEGYYWTALCAGIYARNAGAVEAVRSGVAQTVLENAEQAAAIDPAYEAAGPLRVLGCYWANLPWPLGDTERAADYLRRAVSLAPREASNHFFLAEVQIELGEEDAAKASLQKVLDLSPSGDMRRRAQAMLAKLSG